MMEERGPQEGSIDRVAHLLGSQHEHRQKARGLSGAHQRSHSRQYVDRIMTVFSKNELVLSLVYHAVEVHTEACGQYSCTQLVTTNEKSARLAVETRLWSRDLGDAVHLRLRKRFRCPAV